METTTQKQIENEASKRRNIYLTGEHGAIAYREFLNGAKYAAQSTVLIKDKVSFDELDALNHQIVMLINNQHPLL